MATPLTFERYTGATGGAWYDGVFAVGASSRQPSVKTPIGQLYLTGTKAFAGGGMPPALLGGVTTTRTILAGG
jgi:phytoene dehydrogenase-like protein